MLRCIPLCSGDGQKGLDLPANPSSGGLPYTEKAAPDMAPVSGNRSREETRGEHRSLKSTCSLPADENISLGGRVTKLPA